jgi:glycosyltransferase involved in cell wall biosynthesis
VELKILYLLVDNFSNEKRESFFEKELPYLCASFDKLYIIQLLPDETVLNYADKKIEIIPFTYFQACNRVKILTRNLRDILRVVFYEFTHTHHKIFYLKKIRTNLNTLLFSFSAAEKLEKVISKDIQGYTVFYSYWFRQWVSALSILKMKYSNLILVSRVHGGDYDEDQIKTVLPFRYFQLSKVNKIFAVSDYAGNYLVKNFKQNREKIMTAHLGLDLIAEAAPVDEQQLHIVSCSYLVKLKRVHLIIEILKHLSITYKWTHFGDGPLLGELKEKAKQLKYPAEFKGYVANNDFITYLKTNNISFFINVSESEGIPVTMMEAIANGIPLIGTAVCGIPEIVTEETGFIYPVDFKPRDIAMQIERSHIDKSIYQTKRRERIINFYTNNFSASSNYTNLANKLMELLN